MTRAIYVLPIWGAALWGALWLRNLPGDWGHALCGPWGCGPPLQALASVHTAWAVLLWPLALWLPQHRSLTRDASRRIAAALVSVGVVGVVAVTVHESMSWAPSVGNHAAAFLPQRIAFVIATSTDAPIIQLVVAGLLWSVVTRYKAPAALEQGDPTLASEAAG